jgi:cysteine desulfurase family protein
MHTTRRLYLDNAATSFPKPPAVLEAMTDFATRLGASPGRGAYAEAREAGELMNRCRQRINQLIHGESADHVVFTLNTSDALNLAIRGIVWADASKPRHLVTTHLDHNSVLRPFNALCRHDHITQTRVPVDPVTGLVDPDDIRAAITPDTCLVAVVHGSNVTGTLQPVADIGRICREMAVPLLVDAAQTAGHFPLDVQRDCIDLLAAPGHKGLLGPLGTGLLYIRPGLERGMTTVREGGTGSVSELDTQPDFMPDRFEPGSHNAIGLIGLSEGVRYLLDRGVDRLWAHEQALIRTAVEGLTGDLPGLRLLGPKGVADRCGVFSVRIDTPDDTFADPTALADALEAEFGILTRAGIHCAPLAHDAMGTRSLHGATRLSFGPFVQPQDVKYATDALAELCHRYAGSSSPA